MGENSRARFTNKNDHKLKHLKKFKKENLRLGFPQYKPKKSFLHLPRFLRAIGFWNGDDNAEPAVALHKALHMSVEQRREKIISLLAEIKPGADEGKMDGGLFL